MKLQKSAFSSSRRIVSWLQLHSAFMKSKEVKDTEYTLECLHSILDDLTPELEHGLLREADMLNLFLHYVDLLELNKDRS